MHFPILTFAKKRYYLSQFSVQTFLLAAYWYNWNWPTFFSSENLKKNIEERVKNVKIVFTPMRGITCPFAGVQSSLPYASVGYFA